MRRLFAFFLLLLLSSSSASSASPFPPLRTAEGRTAVGGTSRVLLAGIFRGCERDGRLDQAIERRMNKGGVAVQLLRQASGVALPVCYGESCGKRLRATCPSVPGRVLGGVVVSDRDTLQVRLWLHDLPSGATAYQDDYCQSCDIVSAVTAQAARLLAAPQFGPAPGAQPAYCNASGGTASSPRGTTQLLVLTVFGEGKHKAALQAAVKQQLTILGYKVEPQPIEAGKTTPDPKKLVSGHKNARVLGVEVPREGKLQLFLYDQHTDQTEGKLLDCPDCDGSKDTLVARIQPEVANLLDHCFGDACTQGSTAIPAPPPQACTPFPDFSCGQSTSPQAAPPPFPARHIDATTAKIILGAVWGTASASAVTTAALLIANESGTADIRGRMFESSLSRPFWLGLGTSVLTLAIAIPTTITIKRARSASQMLGNESISSSELQCPN